MATKTVAAPFTVTQALITGFDRPVYVVVNAEGAPVGITFSNAKAGRIVAFRIAQLAEAAAG